MKTIKVNTYTFDELSDKAKEKARDWYRGFALDYDWWDATYEDANTIGLEITAFDCNQRTIEGKLIEDVSSVCDLIRKNHGKKCRTYELAQEYKATNTELDTYEDTRQEFKQALLKEYLVMLSDEEEYLTSDESIDEMIRGNEYSFDVNGSRRITL